MTRPEIILGLVGPIGCKISIVEQQIEQALNQMNYTTHKISLSSSIRSLLSQFGDREVPLSTMDEKIAGGNLVRQKYGPGILAADAIRQIRAIRVRANNANGGTEKTEDDGPADYPLDSACYLVRQLKRPEEVELLEKTYGKRFIQVSIVENKRSRFSNLTRTIRREHPSWDDESCEREARRLILIDEDEKENDSFGQKITEIFHRGDVFISSDDEQTATTTTQRFINALFGKNNVAPTKNEFGSYIAKAASLRSVDLSRQVGAAILTKDGDIITIGCNEVAKPGGGNYWDNDIQKARDIDRNAEANKDETNRIIHDFLDVLSRRKSLAPGLTPQSILSDQNIRKDINESLVGGITEYGRMVHAEMNALSDAARLGRTCQDATMFVTTFPCHTCAKHIIASGIKHVIFIEPYPKSRAAYLYEEAIAFEGGQPGMVEFSHFIGISPRRYRDIFEKGRRRSKNGEIDTWHKGVCSPIIGNLEARYTDSELHAINDNFPSDTS